MTLAGGHLAGPGLGRPRTRTPASPRRSQACCSVPHSRFPHCPGSSHLPAASNQSITSTASPRILVASTFDSGVGWATARRAAGATRRATVPSTASFACQTSQAPQTTRIGEARRWPSPGLTPPRSSALPRRSPACCSPGPAQTFTRTPHTGRMPWPTRPHGCRQPLDHFNRPHLVLFPLHPLSGHRGHNGMVSSRTLALEVPARHLTPLHSPRSRSRS